MSERTPQQARRELREQRERDPERTGPKKRSNQKQAKGNRNFTRKG